jgi:hypothetical protein
MYARIATFEGDPSRMQEVAESMRREIDAGPPEGFPGAEFLFLTGRDSGKTVVIVLFESEDDLRKGDQMMNEMSPPADATDAMGRRVGVEMFDVAVRAKA